MKTKICSHCGEQNPMDNVFCSNCGNVFRNSASGAKAKKRSSHKPVIALLVALIVVVLLCTLAILFWKPSDDDQKPAKDKDTSCSHDWIPANCMNPRICSICGKTTGNPTNHSWIAATCTTAQTCEICGEVSGTAAGHQWLDATSSAPKTCSVCQATEGEPLENALAELLRDRVPIVTYAISSSNRISGYEDAALSQKNDDFYLDTTKGEIVITDVSDDGSALEVTFATKANAAGYAVLWFSFDDILSLEEIEIIHKTTDKHIDTFRLPTNSTNLIEYGGFGSGHDYCFIGTHESGYSVITYPIHAVKILGIRVEDKIAFVKIHP